MVMGQNCCVRLLMRFQHEMSPSQGIQKGLVVPPLTSSLDPQKTQGYPLGISKGFWTHQELIKQGWCWRYRKYAPGDMVLEGLETDAREARKGLWADPHPVPPSEWRKRN